MNVKFGINGLEEPVLAYVREYESEWVHYVYNFYGEGGIYAEEFFPEAAVSYSEIILAMKIRDLIIGEEFDGSIDREIVRDIMLEAREK